MYFAGEELRFESCVITVGQSSSNLHIRKLKWHDYINKYVFISVLHLLTLSGRFGLGVGHDRALTFRDRPRRFEF